jgi:hypothetical protein
MPEDDVFDPNAIPKEDEGKSGSPAEKKSSKKTTEKPTEQVDPALDLSVTPLKIEDDVPLPENNAGRKTAFNTDRMPFGKLEIGQSFLENLVAGKTADGITTKTVMAQVKKSFPDKTFVVRETLDDSGVATSARFWRKK